MKCFTLKAAWHIVAVGNPMHPTAHAWPDQYPQPKEGIVLDETDRTVVIGWEKRIKCSPELLQLAPDTGAIARDGRKVTIFRASVKIENGEPVLVPEQPEDASEALVLLDVGKGRSLNIRYQIKDEQKIVGWVREGGRLDGRDEQLLARFKPFDSVLLVRSDLKWVFWGQEYVRETLDIKFDGQTLFYDTIKTGRRS